jgi:putative thiamine transport system permease protein
VDKTLRRTLNLTTRGLTALTALALLGVAVVLGPVLPGLVWAWAPAVDAAVWQALWASNQWAPALAATLSSALWGTGLACVLAGLAATLAYPGPVWQRLQRRLPLLLSVPHAAFAVGLLFLLAPSGWLARLLAQALGWSEPPAWVTVQDPHGLALALALALKESWFLLWVLMAVLGDAATRRQVLVARTLGHGRWAIWRQVLWPQLLPRLGWPLAAVWAYSLSVVDMAVVLGPANPPTLAVLGWHWLTDPDPAQQALGAATSLVLLGLFALGAGAARLGWRAWRAASAHRLPAGPRGVASLGGTVSSTVPGPVQRCWRAAVAGLANGAQLIGLLTGAGWAVVAVLALWSVAGAWFFPALWPGQLSLRTWLQADWQPFITTLWLALAAVAVCLPVALLWLEWGPKRLNALLYAPLVVPALPLVAAQYAALLHTGLDGGAVGLVWSHLLWVLPYVVLTLVGPYRALDPRYATLARTLGQTRWQVCWRVKWPLLVRPMLTAASVGLAVSVAQYLPTLFASGGRFATVTTEAVSLSAGGNYRLMAVHALLQILIPLAGFALAAWLGWQVGRHRQGLRG